MQEVSPEGVGSLVEVLDQHGEVGMVMKVSLMAIEGVMAVKAPQSLAGGLAPREEAPKAIELVGPSSIASPGPSLKLSLLWTIKEHGSSLLDSMKAKELLLGTTLFADATLLRCMSIGKALACMYHCAIAISGSFLQDSGHHFYWMLIAWCCRWASVLKH